MSLRERLDEVAARYGLTRVAGFMTMAHEGRVQGVPIAVHAAQNSDAKWLEVRARAALGSDVALDVSPGGFLTKPSEFAVPDGAFMGIFALRCAPADTASAATLLDGPVRAGMLRLASLGTATLRDDGVACRLGSDATVDEIASAVDTAVSTATAFGENVRRCAPPAALLHGGVAAGFMTAARARGLEVIAHPLTARGALGGDAFELRFFTQIHNRPRPERETGPARVPGYALALRFSTPLAVGLRLRPAGWADRAQSALGLEDLQLGDAAFDRAWRIDARDAAGARAALGEAARSTLTKLAAAGLEPSLGDDGLTGHGPVPASGDDAAGLLTLLASLRSALRGQTAEKPYR